MTAASRRIIVLDRDGVINVDLPGKYVCSAEQWKPIDGSLEAMAALSRTGYDVYVVSNQSGIGRGLFTEADLAAMHAKLLTLLADRGGTIAGWFYCPHTPAARCRCRKPAPGLLESVAAAARRSLEGVAMIGDKWSDLQAARAMQMRAILVATGHGRVTLEAHAGDVSEFFPSLEFAVRALLDGAAR